MTGNEYLLDNQQPEAGERFDALGELFNASTFRHLLRLGLAEGWRVWEVGAGSPSVPSWVHTQTKARVVASDIDTSWLEAANAPYEILQHDVGVELAPEGPFDLVHARLVLVHVRERANAIATMIEALQPGGWLLLEEADPGLQPLACPDDVGEEQQRANRLKNAFRALLAERGVDLAFGRTLPRLLRTAGLEHVGGDAFFPMSGPACNDLERATIEQIRDQLTSRGLATHEDIEAHLDAVNVGRLDLATSPMVSAWGQKPL